MNRYLTIAILTMTTCAAAPAFAQRPPAPAAPAPRAEHGDDEVAPRTAPQTTNADALEVVTAGKNEAAAATTAPLELFPLADRVWMRALDLKADETTKIDAARKNEDGSWLCKRGKDNPDCHVDAHLGEGQGTRSGILTAIRLKVPTMAAPISVWSRADGLLFNPRLVGHQLGNPGRWSALLAPGPVTKSGGEAPRPSASTPAPSFEGELQAHFRWPQAAESSDYQYIVVADACNNAIVTRFTREFTIPVQVEDSESCTAGSTEGPLKLFKSGTVLRVTAFNLEKPARGNVMATSYRVEAPSLESTEGRTVASLVPDLARDDLRIECAPQKHDNHKRAGRPFAGESFVIAPEPLQSGRCRLIIDARSLARMTLAPVMLHVVIERLDQPIDAPGRMHLDERWLVAPGSREFTIRSLPGIEGDARLRLTVSSDPAAVGGTGVFYSDAVRAVPQGVPDSVPFRRDIATATITTAALCGTWDPRTLDETGTCARVYVTFPVLLATLQVTRAPWVEKPLVDPSVPGGVGVALAVDSYDPARQKAFPIALQLGGAYERLTNGKSGILGYVGIAPSLPVLGTGGTTTSIGLLGGVGVAYVMDSAGPNEGFKPAAFAAIVVTTGQFVLRGSARP